jgi:hypothetical protein
MPIIYRTAGPWGAGKGANLVPGEVDGNFYDVDRRLFIIEDSAQEVATGIAFFSVSGDLFYVHMTNGTIQGPFALPDKKWNFRGPWLPSTVYSRDDVVTANGGVYLVLLNHVSAAVFVPGANDGSAHNYYGLLLTNPANVLPSGGLTGQYLMKTSDTSYVIGWQTPTTFPSQKVLEAPDPTYTLTLDNIASYVRCVNGSGCTITVNADATLNFPLGTEVSFRQCTNAGVTLVAATGVIFNLIEGFSAKTARNGAVITAKKIAASKWDVFGYVTP